MMGSTLRKVKRVSCHLGSVAAAFRKKKMRIDLISRTCLTLVLAIVSAGALAGQDDGERRGGKRDEGREQRHDERRDRGGDGHDRGNEGRGERQMPQPYQPQPQAQPQPPPAQQDGGRRNGRMSVEERRALRRQIDQASHDIYPPGR